MKILLAILKFDEAPATWGTEVNVLDSPQVRCAGCIVEISFNSSSFLVCRT